MNYYQLYKLVSRNQKLSDRRHPMFEKNQAMKVFMAITVAVWAIYLMMFGVLGYFAFSDMSIEAFDYIDGGMVFFLALDFATRFGMQETPAQDIKPYMLLPIRRSFLLGTFLFRMGLRGYNFFWYFFFLPFGLLAIVPFYGFVGLVGFLLGWWFVMVLNSYWYLIWRTLSNRNVLYLIIPVAIYGALIYFGYFFDEKSDWAFQGTAHYMRWFITGNPLAYLVFVVICIPLLVVNYWMQKHSIYYEISRDTKVTKFKSREWHAFDRFGEIGEYLKLEIKSTMRNSVVRTQFITGCVCMLMLCSLFSFTDVYDSSPFMRTFIIVYCFSCLGAMTLTSVMCAEGNYIDFLMSRKESVLSLLKAKYYFHCTMLIVPFLFSIMPLSEGKVAMIDMIGCLLFTSGVLFPCLFQLAVYNNTTLHLNEKMTKQSGTNSKTQMLVSLASLFVPMIIMYLLKVSFSDTVAAIAMAVIGLVGTSLHGVWIRNIYTRFMKRRHVNMSGFRDSR